MAALWSTLALLSLASATTVDLGYTRYEGATVSGVTQWLGMRFAAPPVGALRFAAPQDPLPVEGIQQATEVCVSLRSRMRGSVLIADHLIARIRVHPHCGGRGAARPGWHIRGLPLFGRLCPLRCYRLEGFTCILLHTGRRVCSELEC